MLSCDRSQQIGIKHGRVANPGDGSGQEINEFRIVHDFRTRGIDKERLESAAHFAGFVPPSRARHAGLRAKARRRRCACRNLRPRVRRARDRAIPRFLFLWARRQETGRSPRRNPGRSESSVAETEVTDAGNSLSNDVKTQFGVEFAQGIRVGLAPLEFVERERDGRVGCDLRELL